MLESNGMIKIQMGLETIQRDHSQTIALRIQEYHSTTFKAVMIMITTDLEMI